MKLLFDNIIFDLQKSGGISVVWYELLSRLLNDASRKDDIRFLDNPHADNHLRPLLQIPQDSIIGRPMRTFISRPLPVKTTGKEPFIFHSSYYRYCTNPKAINITTLHDFTNEFFNTGIKKHIHTWQKFRAIRHSNYIICISENTKRDLHSFLPDIPDERIRVIYNGVSEDYHPLDNPATDLPFPSHSYVLFVGNRASYKNFKLTVQGVAESSYNLVITGPQLSEEEIRFIHSILPPERYKSLGFVDNQHLNILYNHALCLSYPSSYEGFGIPIIEAQRAGCPVIAYRATSIPEVCGKSPLLMEKDCVEAFVEKLQLLSKPDIVQTVRAEGLINSKRFTWDAMYNRYIQLYDEIINNYQE